MSILGAVADSQFQCGRWHECIDTVQEAFRIGADMGNPFIRLRLGQCLFELGSFEEASNWMVPAYLSEGSALFAGENPKYLASFRSRLEPPPGGWPQGW